MHTNELWVPIHGETSGFEMRREFNIFQLPFADFRISHRGLPNNLRGHCLFKKFKVLLCSALIFSTGLGQPPQSRAITDLQPTVLLISVDGFRPHYLEVASAPVLRELAASGVRAKWMIPVFPTKTFPNHYSIVTGLYAENHGVVGNTMYDPEFDEVFTMRKRKEVSNGRWWGGEPVWITAEKQGQRSAPFFWPGSEAEISGVRPTYWRPFDGNLRYTDRVNQVLAWLDLPRHDRPTFVTLYFEGVDNAGHRYGPVFPAVDTAIADIDEALGTLFDGLKVREIFDKVNIMVVSDHGMSGVSSQRSVNLDDMIDLKGLRVIDYGAVVLLWPPAEKVETIYEKLRNFNTHISVYKKSEIPARFHYRNHRRIAPLVLITDDGWTITRSGGQSAWRTRDHGGNHGFDNQLESMRATFIAHGPAFKSGVLVEPFENIHLYSLMTHVLGLRPARNDGNLAEVRSLFRN